MWDMGVENIQVDKNPWTWATTSAVEIRPIVVLSEYIRWR